jgi:hypothetical protein
MRMVFKLGSSLRISFIFISLFVKKSNKIDLRTDFHPKFHLTTSIRSMTSHSRMLSTTSIPDITRANTV